MSQACPGYPGCREQDALALSVLVLSYHLSLTGELWVLVSPPGPLWSRSSQMLAVLCRWAAETPEWCWGGTGQPGWTSAPSTLLTSAELSQQKTWPCPLRSVSGRMWGRLLWFHLLQHLTFLWRLSGFPTASTVLCVFIMSIMCIMCLCQVKMCPHGPT